MLCAGRTELCAVATVVGMLASGANARLASSIFTVRRRFIGLSPLMALIGSAAAVSSVAGMALGVGNLLLIASSRPELRSFPAHG